MSAPPTIVPVYTVSFFYHSPLTCYAFPFAFILLTLLFYLLFFISLLCSLTYFPLSHPFSRTGAVPLLLPLILLFRSRLSWWRVPAQAVPRPDGELQSARKTRPKRLCTHRGGTWPHAAANHRRGECVRVCVCFIRAEV